MKRNTLMLLIGLLTAFQIDVSASTKGEATKVQVGIDEHLGARLPLEATFTDETGKSITLGQVIGHKPTILSMVYYECPGLCTPLLNGMTEALDKIQLRPGRDFQVVTVSFNPRDSFITAQKKRHNYLKQLKRKDFPQSAWRFLTGDQASIDRLTTAVGFLYKKEGADFLHSGAIYAISPEGKIARYLYGVEYNPFDVEMAMMEASQGKTGPTINKLLRYCYSYDPSGRNYVLRTTQIVGATTLLAAGCFLAYLGASTRKRNDRIASGEGDQNDRS